MTLLLALLLSTGCEPKCREVEPLSEVRAQLHDRIEDRLDDADASDAQIAKVEAAFEATLPALQRFRAETHPGEREAMAELRRDQPGRERLAAIIDRNVASWQRYARALVDAMLVAHAVFRPEQRRAMAAEASKPSDRSDSTFMLDRAVDYFLMRIDANAAQEKLVMRIKADLLARGQKLRRQADALRAEAFGELAKDAPDRARVYATIDRGGALARELFRDLAGYYLLLESKLDARQRSLLKAELVRFEPCKANDDAAAQTSAKTVPGA